MSCGRGGGQVLGRSAPIWLLAFNSRVLLFPGPTRDACEVAVPRGWVAPGTHLSSPCCACRQLPTFREFFGSVGPRLQDWVQALRATAGGSAQAPTPDGEQLPEETWLFLQVLGEKWAEGNTAPMTVPAGSIPLSYPMGAPLSALSPSPSLQQGEELVDELLGQGRAFLTQLRAELDLDTPLEAMQTPEEPTGGPVGNPVLNCESWEVGREG